MDNTKRFVLIISVGILILLGIYVINQKVSEQKYAITGGIIKDVNLNDFAKCISQSAKLYGAYWCPHCKDQKALFGESVKYINYVECDASGENAKPEECQAAGITGYPTWIINNQKYEGFKKLEELASLTNCKL